MLTRSKEVSLRPTSRSARASTHDARKSGPGAASLAPGEEGGQVVAAFATASTPPTIRRGRSGRGAQSSIRRRRGRRPAGGGERRTGPSCLMPGASACRAAHGGLRRWVAGWQGGHCAGRDRGRPGSAAGLEQHHGGHGSQVQAGHPGLHRDSDPPGGGLEPGLPQAAPFPPKASTARAGRSIPHSGSPCGWTAIRHRSGGGNPAGGSPARRATGRAKCRPALPAPPPGATGRAPR